MFIASLLLRHLQVIKMLSHRWLNNISFCHMYITLRSSLTLSERGIRANMYATKFGRIRSNFDFSTFIAQIRPI